MELFSEYLTKRPDTASFDFPSRPNDPRRLIGAGTTFHPKKDLVMVRHTEQGLDSAGKRPVKIFAVTKRWVVNFEALLPTGWSFAEDATRPTLHANFNSQTISIPRVLIANEGGTHGGLKIGSQQSELEVRGSPYKGGAFEVHDFLSSEGSGLGILHEIGHVKSFPLREDRENERGQLIAAVKKYGYKLLTRAEKREYERLVIGEERSAWSIAKGYYWALRREGINLEPNMWWWQIRSHANACVDSYKENRSFPPIEY